MSQITKSFSLVTILAAFQITSAWAGVCAKDIIRGAFDIGSGTTKIKIARIDTCSNKILQILADSAKDKTLRAKVSYKKDLLKSKEGNLSDQIMKDGIKSIQTLISAAEAKAGATPDMYVGVATEAFRNAHNGEAFIQKIMDETKVQVFIPDQAQEGMLEWTGVLNRLQGTVNPKTLIVWGIGSGSMQIETMAPNGKDVIQFLGSVASDGFAVKLNSELKNITYVNPDTKAVEAAKHSPNPIAFLEEEKSVAVDLAKRTAETMLANDSNAQVFRDKLQAPGTAVIGVGGVLNDGVRQYINPNGNKFGGKDVKELMDKWIDATDAALPGSKAFKNTTASNFVMVYGFMADLNIDTVFTSDVNLTDGVFFVPAFLKEGNKVIRARNAGNKNYKACAALSGGENNMSFTVAGRRGGDLCRVPGCITQFNCTNNGGLMVGNTLCVSYMSNAGVAETALCRAN